jgi:hypothetical protein
MKPLLSQLLNPDFAVSLGVTTSPHSIRRALAGSPIVREVRQALRGGIVTEADIREFVDEISASFQKGVRFPYEAALAALAFVVETRKTEFADDFLIDLARLQRFTEFQFAPQVGALCRQRWRQVPTTTSRREKLPLHYQPQSTHVIRELPASSKSAPPTPFHSLETV